MSEKTLTRLAEVRARLGITQQQMADAAGVGKRTYCYYEAGERDVPSEVLKNLAKIGVNPSYQIYGDGPMLLPKADVVAALEMLDRALHDDASAVARTRIVAEQQVRVAKTISAGYENGDVASGGIAEMGQVVGSQEFVLIPSLGIMAGASRGKIAIYEPKGHLAFQRSWFIKRRLNPMQCATLEISGPSMEEKLFHGDTVLLDRKDSEIRSGKTYASRLDDEIMVKHLHWLPGGVLNVISANEEFAPFTIQPHEMTPETFDVLGRVRGSSHDWD